METALQHFAGCLEPEHDGQMSGDSCAICCDWVCQECLDYRYMRAILTCDPICDWCADDERKDETCRECLESGTGICKGMYGNECKLR